MIDFLAGFESRVENCFLIDDFDMVRCQMTRVEGKIIEISGQKGVHRCQDLLKHSQLLICIS